MVPFFNDSMEESRREVSVKTGVIEKALSAAIFLLCIGLLLQGWRLGMARLVPIFLAPVTMIWFPERASEYFSSRVTADTIRNWGWVLLLLLGLPALVGTVALRG